jgi:hypothetical protein
VGNLAAGAPICGSDARASKLLAALAGALADKGTSNPDSTITPPDGWSEEIAAVHNALGDEFLTQLPSFLRPNVAVPVPVLDWVYRFPSALAEFHGCGFTDQLIAHADTPDKALAILSNNRVELTSNAAGALVTTVGWDDPDLWATALQTVAAEHPDMAYGQVAEMVDTLNGPEAGHVPLPVLARSVRATVSSGMSRLPGELAPAAISTLIRSEDDDVLTAACEWASTLDIGAADHDLVSTVISVDDMHSIKHADLTALRTRMAAQLLARAGDQSRGADERVQHLQLAATANPQAARAAAFDLAESGVPDVRLAAADILATVPGTYNEEARIRALLRAAKTVPLTAKLTDAMNRLKSPGVAEAIDGLVGLLGLVHPASKLQPANLIRDHEDHDRFIAAVDEVRSTNGTTSNVKPFINAGVVLADLLVDFIVVACGDTGAGVNAKELKAIRENAAGRPDAGALVNRQQLLQLFDWFPQVATLRKRRTAHPSPAGSRTPVAVSDSDHAYARNLLADIVAGWIDSMSAYPLVKP